MEGSSLGNALSVHCPPADEKQFKRIPVTTRGTHTVWQVAAGEVEIQGGIYDLETGRVEFLGESPNQATLVKSGAALPPSLA